MKSKLRIQYLIEAYKVLEHLTMHGANSEMSSSLGDAVSNIQLFGTKKQVLLIHDFIEDMAQTQTASVVPIMNALRYEIRQELNLEQVNTEVKTINIT